MPQNDERNYLDVMMENISKAQEKTGSSFAEATTINAMVKAAWDEMTINKFIRRAKM